MYAEKLNKLYSKLRRAIANVSAIFPWELYGISGFRYIDKACGEDYTVPDCFIDKNALPEMGIKFSVTINTFH